MTDRRKQYKDQLYCHFITFSCHRRRRLLAPDPPKQFLLKQLAQQLSRQSATCVGYVIMPDHVHLMVWFPEKEQLSRFMQNWKRLSSFEIRRWWENNRQNYCEIAELNEKIWTPKYYSFEITGTGKLKEKLSYMHQNPVRAGFVNTAVEWIWSSARFYELKQSVHVPVSWIE